MLQKLDHVLFLSLSKQSASLFRRNGKFIRQDPSQVPVIPENTYSSATNQTSVDMGSPSDWANSSAKQTQTMTQSCESPHPRVTAAEDGHIRSLLKAGELVLPIQTQRFCDIGTVNFNDIC